MKRKPEKDIAQYIEQAVLSSRPKRLIDLLEENRTEYQGKSTNEIIRIRGFTLGSFKNAGLPKKAMAYVLEELENGKHPYLIAGAARGLRGQKKPFSQAIPYLLQAIKNLAHGDDSISFDSLIISDAKKNYTTAHAEIFETLRWYGVHAKPYLKDIKELQHCQLNFSEENKATYSAIISEIGKDESSEFGACCGEQDQMQRFSFLTRIKRAKKVAEEEIELEDHSGTIINYKDFFCEKPVIAVFFYTRCDNPNKCSLTITRLAQLQKILKATGLGGQVKTAAFTYDSVYDVPYRLKNYCITRQMDLNADNRCFRVLRGFDSLQSYLHLGVNYIGSMVNKHKIELYLIDKKGAVRWGYTRLRWDHALVLKKVKDLINNKKNAPELIKNVLHNVLSVILFIGIAFFPKCPMCWAAYMSVIGISSLHAIAFRPWLIPFFALGLSINLYVLWRGCKNRNYFIPFYISSTGATLILISNFLLSWKIGSMIGLAFILLASLLNSFSLRAFNLCIQRFV